jgi:hypothetical protein
MVQTASFGSMRKTINPVSENHGTAQKTLAAEARQ